MENLVNDIPSPKRNYEFIDTIRCISMMSIVGEHCLGSPNFTSGTAKYWVYILLVQLIKFGTVIFFLLAGFLIGDKFTDYTPAQYLKRRFSNTFGPWIFWSLMFVLCFIINLHVKENIYHDGRFTLAAIWDGVMEVYLLTNYWFIINFMISITLLLLFKRYLYNIFFGAVLLCFTLFYCINIHFEWIPPHHTTAILGFVFFLWMGAQLRRHWINVQNVINRIPYTGIVALAIITFAISVSEIILLKGKNSIDPYNTLRVSNIFYSLAIFGLLLKKKDIPVISYFKPRETTYGIYLIHYILIIFLLPEILKPVNIDIMSVGAWGFAFIFILEFVFVYAITWGLVILISRSKIKLLVGN